MSGAEVMTFRDNRVRVAYIAGFGLMTLLGAGGFSMPSAADRMFAAILTAACAAAAARGFAAPAVQVTEQALILASLFGRRVILLREIASVELRWAQVGVYRRRFLALKMRDGRKVDFRQLSDNGRTVDSALLRAHRLLASRVPRAD